MKKNKLIKLLLPLFLLVAIPLSLGLLKQNQDTRRRADTIPSPSPSPALGSCQRAIHVEAEPTKVPDATATPTIDVCVMPTPPTISIISESDYENPVLFQWQSMGAPYIETEFFKSGLLVLEESFSDPPESKIVKITVDVDQETIVKGVIRSKSVNSTTNMDDCVENNETSCCIVEASAEICLSALNPDPASVEVSESENICEGKDYKGSVIRWIDRSNHESGFTVYQCENGATSCPNGLNYVSVWSVEANVTEYLDCDSAYDASKIYGVASVSACGIGGDPSPYPTASPYPTNTPYPTSSPTPMPTNTPVPLLPTSTTVPGEPSSTPAPTNTSVPLPTSTFMPTNTPVPLLPTSTTVPGEPSSTPAPTNTSIPLIPTNTPAPLVGGYDEPTTVPTIDGIEPTRIILPEAGFDFPLKGLGIVGSIVTLLGFLIIL